MLVSWAGDYVGIPYELEGSTRSGADCWGICRLVLKEQFGVDLPAFSHPDEGSAEFAAVVGEAIPLLGYKRVEVPEIGDLVLLRIVGLPCHIGIVVGTPGDKNLLHTLRGHISAIDRYDGMRWNHRVEGFYRVV